MLPRDVLKSYLREMPRGHIFDLTYKLFAGECGCDLVDNQAEGRFELTRR
jgi:hypothetical protein